MSSGKFSAGNLRGATMNGLKVLEMRQRYAEGESQSSLARAFGISAKQVGRIVRGEAWKVIGGGRRATEAEQDIDAALQHLAIGSPPTPDEIKASQAKVLAMLNSAPKGFTDQGIDEAREAELMNKLNGLISDFKGDSLK